MAIIDPRVLVLFLVISITSVSGFVPFSFAENNVISEHVSNPKKPMDSEILLKDIQCKDEHVLVILDNDKIACVRGHSTEKINWHIIETDFSINDILDDNDNNINTVNIKNTDKVISSPVILEPSIKDLAIFLLNHYPEGNYKHILIEMGFTQTYIDRFFEQNPKMLMPVTSVNVNKAHNIATDYIQTLSQQNITANNSDQIPIIFSAVVDDKLAVGISVNILSQNITYTEIQIQQVLGIDAPIDVYHILMTDPPAKINSDFNHSLPDNLDGKSNIALDTAPPIILAPDTINIAATGVLTWANLSTNVYDAIDPSPVLTHNASQYLPLGNTTILWTATDAMGNQANKTSTITVTSDFLDGDWHYKLIETRSDHPLPYSALSIGKNTKLQAVSLRPTDVSLGTLHFFKTFSKDILTAHNGSIIVELELRDQPNMGIHVLDGDYSKTKLSDFASARPILKGGGILASYTHTHTHTPEQSELSNILVKLSPDLSRSELDDITIFIDNTRLPEHGVVFIRSIELENHSKWMFNDYKVYRNYDHGYGTFLFVTPPDEESIYSLPIHDTFDDLSNPELPFDGWTYWSDTDTNTLDLSHDTRTNNKSVHIAVDGHNTWVGITKNIDISNLDANNQRLVISLDYKATSSTSFSTITNSYIILYDADSNDFLVRQELVRGGTTDSGWQTYTTDITDVVVDYDTIQITFISWDGWRASHNIQSWYDNIQVYVINQTQIQPTTKVMIMPTVSYESIDDVLKILAPVCLEDNIEIQYQDTCKEFLKDLCMDDTIIIQQKDACKKILGKHDVRDNRNSNKIHEK